MTWNMVWLWCSFSLVGRIWVLWAQGHGFEPRKEQYIFLNVLARMVEWFKTHRLSRCSLGSAGSNPASRKFNIHINNNFRVIINFLYNIINII